ncbi:MAG: ribonucleotide reductase subunit alpha [Gammaproteobacteria bacterium]|nr:ribonucleotide reductase subunit alpha [Gammaproteobacteria bacterium]
MNIATFDDLLKAAADQPEPQRLLLVFVAAGLPKNHTQAQKDRFQAGQGGLLNPVLCVDKLPAEIKDFEGLVAESAQTGQSWDMVFVAALSGRAGIPPSSDEADQPLRMMVGAVQNGQFQHYLAFKRTGEPVAFH